MNTLKTLFKKHYPLLLFLIYSIPYTWSLLWYKESTSDILLSLVLLSAITLTLHFITLHFKKGANGVLMSVILIWIFLYMEFAHFHVQVMADLVNLKFRYPAFVVLLLLCLLLYRLMKAQKQFTTINKALSYFILAFLLVGMVMRMIAFVPYQNISLKTASGEKLKQIKITPPDMDVYYLVFDSYTSSNSLRAYHNFNNSPLEEELKQKGFKVTENTRSKYDVTPYSLASVFGMDTLTNAFEWGKIVDEPVIRAAALSVQRSALFEMLDKADVPTYAYSLFPIHTSENKKITWDLVWASPLKRLYQGTALGYVYESYFEDNTFNDQEVEGYLKKNLSKNNKSAFYFYHFYAPHSGYGRFHPLYKKPYTDRITNANERMLRVVNQIFESNKRPFIIVIQGDHGSREIEPENKNHPERLAVFNAIYFPDQDYRQVEDDFKPINTFRLILNKFFGTNLSLL